MNGHSEPPPSPHATAWQVAWPALLFWALSAALGTWARLSHARCVSGEDPGYLLWSATEHTSRSALALTLVIWAIMPGSSGPTGGAAQYD
ncbi:hypothetical protein Poly30_50590 [Planctomycetes bacterium Poly30]|uniref:Uncharacterized protein n=1 Tax=Saltatorellus ferox TaxID=2528018 RepID=A0A518EZJ8_9BACT|nr:hypothetical protein Poly30_50590 [Planctomycetes bacterium Poly30]